jgi:hypothetical protein
VVVVFVESTTMDDSMTILGDAVASTARRSLPIQVPQQG